MLLIRYTLVELLQAGKLPWGLLAVSALILLIGVSLVAYFFNRLRRTEKEAEEDWGPGRSLFVVPAEVRFEAPPQRVEQLTEPDQTRPATGSSSDRPAAREAPLEGTAGIIEAAQPQPVGAPELPLEPPRQEAFPGPQEAKPVSPDQQPVTVAPPIVVAESTGAQAPGDGSPFSDEIWQELEHADHGAPEQAKTPTEGKPVLTREPFEPPRIVPIEPRERAALRTSSYAPNAAGSTPLTSASERGSRPEARFDAVPPAKSAPVAPAKAGVPASGIPVRAHAPAGSVLGLPAESARGPLVLGEPRRARASGDVDTLANYGREPDDTVGHGGTIALLLAIFLVAGGVLAYVFIQPFHSSVNELVARIRGAQPAPPEKPRAQVFPGHYDGTKNPTQVSGAVQNISDDALSNLYLEVSLIPRGGGAADSRKVPVTPDQIAAGQQGSYEFELDIKQFGSYKVNKLLTKDGAEVKFISPGPQK